ncbi:MAG: thioredoxin domain-containing protein [Legionellales bacterium]|nr:thioredoxin domain-containing protein [Legionellales bacterium]
MVRSLVRGIFFIFMGIALAGCGKSKYASLYNSLPINTDGNPTGKIAVVEFLDYSDLDSLKMATILNEVMEQRPNVRIIYHPIIINPKKAYFTKLVLAAGLQDRFLAAHHLMVNASNQLTENQTIDLLSQAFVDVNELKRREDSAEVESELSADEKLAQTWQVNKVPAFFIGRVDHKPQKLVGPQTLIQLLAVIDQESAK